MSSNKGLLIDTMAAHTAIQFIISVLSDEQKKRLENLVTAASALPAEAEISDEIKSYMEEMHLKVQEMVKIGTGKTD
ncbi:MULTISPECIES: hypothetical protein [Pantoea]|uniref:hypothetical protein n=1 Tax=Pantoea TaxID=53335 RepID=UPI000D76CA82|nr:MULTISPECIES: hypothetical protein [Pantoea]PXW18979.1 hypothetical protein BY447_0544 [Pantoea sp. JKS000250]